MYSWSGIILKRGLCFESEKSSVISTKSDACCMEVGHTHYFQCQDNSCEM